MTIFGFSAEIRSPFAALASPYLTDYSFNQSQYFIYQRTNTRLQQESKFVNIFLIKIYSNRTRQMIQLQSNAWQ